MRTSEYEPNHHRIRKVGEMSAIRAELNTQWAEILDRYYQGESVASLAKSTGYDPSSIHKRISADKAENGDRGPRPKTQKDVRAYANKKSISQLHFRIGLAVSLARTKMGLSPTAFGLEIQQSNIKVRNIEIGCHDLTLTEIQRIADFIGFSLEDMILAKTEVIHAKTQETRYDGANQR